MIVELYYKFITTTMRTTKKRLGEVSFKSEDGRQTLFLKVDPAIEKIFRTKDIETSESYKDVDGDGLDFYSLKGKLSTILETYVSKVCGRSSNHRIALREYGFNLIRKDSAGHRYFNLSILRTVGIGEGVEVDVEGIVDEDDVQEWGRSLSDFLKFLYSRFIDKNTTEFHINIEE